MIKSPMVRVGGVQSGGGEGKSVGSDEERGYVLSKRYTGAGERNGAAAGDQGLAIDNILSGSIS